MMVIKWFYRIQCIKAVFSDGTSKLRNMPMYDNDIKVYKNAQTKLALEVKRADRKALRTGQDKILFLNVISHTGDNYLLRKQFTVQDIEKGRLDITIAKEDLDSLDCGRYFYSVSFVNNGTPDTNEYLLHIGLDGSSYGQFEIDQYALPTQRPPYVQTKFTEVRTYKVTIDNSTDGHDLQFISSRLPIRNLQHTVNVQLTNFDGLVIIETTKDIDPYDQESWTEFDRVSVATSDVSKEFVFTDINTDFKFFRVKFIRFVDNEGTADKLTYI